MRDQHRLKEKYELDNRQIITFSFIGLLLLGGAFVLGIMVGKKLQAEQAPLSAPDLLSALDQKAEQKSESLDASLTFQQELTKASPKPAPEPVAPPPSPKPVELAVEKVDPPAPKPPVAKVEEPVRAEAPKMEEVATRTAPTKDAGLREAIARAQRPTEATPDGTWTLQLSAYQDRTEADRFAASLRDRGYAPFIVEAALPKGTWYRVRMGRFPSKEAASRYLADFKRETHIEAFVTGAN